MGEPKVHKRHFRCCTRGRGDLARGTRLCLFLESGSILDVAPDHTRTSAFLAWTA